MSISILNRGASGGLKPELTVIAPSGSTIDLLQNGIIVATYTLGASETEHTFVVKVGTYTVRGTRGDKTEETELVIDAIAQYEITVSFANYLMLYDYGDECEDITGGWVASHSGKGTHTVNRNSDSIRLAYSNSNNQAGTTKVVTNKNIDKTNICGMFSDAYGSVTYTAYQSAPVGVGGGLSSDHAYNYGSRQFRYSTNVTSTEPATAYMSLYNGGSGSGSRSGELIVYHLGIFYCDDWQTLCTKTGIPAPADLATLIADTTSINAILADETAVMYMATMCTGDFMVSFVANSACLSALDASLYKRIVTASKHWAKFLDMVQ